MSRTLFPTTLPELQWREFAATGFAQPVSGVIHRTANPPLSIGIDWQLERGADEG